MCSNTPAQIVSCSSVIMGPLLSRPLGLVECNNYFSGDVLEMVLGSKFGNMFEKVSSASVMAIIGILMAILTVATAPLCPLSNYPLKVCKCARTRGGRGVSQAGIRSSE